MFTRWRTEAALPFTILLSGKKNCKPALICTPTSLESPVLTSKGNWQHIDWEVMPKNQSETQISISDLFLLVGHWGISPPPELSSASQGSLCRALLILAVWESRLGSMANQCFWLTGTQFCTAALEWSCYLNITFLLWTVRVKKKIPIHLSVLFISIVFPLDRNNLKFYFNKFYLK